MARGYPDFFGYQTFYSYGTPIAEVNDPLIVVAGAVGDPIDLTGKGRSYGGYLSWAVKAADIGLFTVDVIIDGNSLTPFNIPNAWGSGAYQNDSYFFKIDGFYFDTDYYLLASFIPNWSWGQTLKVRFDLTACANNISVYAYLYWARVE